MANGDVTVRLTALDIASKAVRQVRQEMAGLQSTQAQQIPALQRMRQEFAATRAQIDQLGQRTRALAVTQQQAAVATASITPQLTGMRRQMFATGQGIGTVRSTMASLTAMAIGTRGTLGTLGSAMLFFSFGNLVSIGIIGGIAALALGYRKITEDSRRTREEAGKALDRIREAASRAHRPLGQLSTDLQAMREQLTALAQPSLLERIDAILTRLPGVAPTAVAARAAQRRGAAGAELRAGLAVGTEEERRRGLRELLDGLTTQLGLLEDARELGRLSATQRIEAADIERQLIVLLRTQNVELEQRLAIERQLLDLSNRRAQEAFRIPFPALAGAFDRLPPVLREARERFLREQQRQLPAPFRARGVTGPFAGVQALGPTLAGGQPPTATIGPELQRLFGELFGPQERLARLQDMLTAAWERGAISLDRYEAAQAFLNEQQQKFATTSQQVAGALIAGASQLIAAAIEGRGGGVLGFLGRGLGLGASILAFTNPLAAAGLAGGAAIFGALQSRSQRTPVHIASIGPDARRDLQDDRPILLTLNVRDISGRTIAQIRELIRQSEIRDATPRTSPGTTIGVG
jgi:hypothetical protein